MTRCVPQFGQNSRVTARSRSEHPRPARLRPADIACSTGLSINSVKSYIRGAYRKIHVTTRSQAVLWALENGCVHQPTTCLAELDELMAEVTPVRHGRPVYSA